MKNTFLKKDNSKIKKENLGAYGEELASLFLQERGYQILEKNYRTRYGEIDLVAKENDVLVFVEVKTRRGKNFGLPEEAISQKKIKKIIKAAKNYLKEKGFKDKDFRVEMVAIELGEDDFPQIRHHKDLEI